MSKKNRMTAKALKVINGSTKSEARALAKHTTPVCLGERVLLRGPKKEIIGTVMMIDGTVTFTFPEGVIIASEDNHRTVTAVLPAKKAKKEKKEVDPAPAAG